MWVSRQHYALMQDQLAQARHSADELNARLERLEQERLSLTQTMLGWQRMRLEPVSEAQEQRQPESWEERMEAELRELRKPEDQADGQS